MTVYTLAREAGFTVEAGADAEDREVKGVYCCDLLSMVMGRAKADTAWITVISNVNSLAVASLADVACIVIAEGVPVDAETRAKAEQQEILILSSPLPVFETGLAIHRCIGAAE